MSATGNAGADTRSEHGANGTRDRVVLVRAANGDVVVRLSGVWHLGHGMPSASDFKAALTTGARPQRVSVDSSAVKTWDSSLITFVLALDDLCNQQAIAFDRTNLPAGLNRLIELAEAVPDKDEAKVATARTSFAGRLGTALIVQIDAAGKFVEFVGMVALAFLNFVSGRSRYRRSDLLEVIQQCGANALGIVSLISYLVGVILAFMGAVQLQQFGAAIYVADLVGIGMVREMGAMMTAIIMAGRTGAAFAARLGTMKVTQEIDALATMGISPMEFLVLPRVIALVLMMPLLCLYSDLVGILGGASIGVAMLGLSFSAYMHETIHAITFGNLAGGLFKATVYGALIAYAGCLRGFQCGNSSSAVGDAATAAVVTAIVMIVTACGLFAMLFHVIGI